MRDTAGSAAAPAARCRKSRRGSFIFEPPARFTSLNHLVVFALVESRPQNDGKETDMSDWLHNLPVLWMSLVVFGFTYLVTAAIYVTVSVFAVGERARSFKAISPGLLPPLGIIFARFVAFTASQVWTDTDKAKA